MDRKLALLIQFAAADKLSGSLRSIIGLGQTGSEKLGAMKREARALDRELKDVRKELSGTSGNVTALMDRERELERRIEGANAALERQAGLLKIGRQADRISQRGQELRSSGTENIVTGVAMAAPGVLAVRQAMTFESAMADVRKVVAFEKPEQFRAMADDLLDLSTRIPMTAEGLATIVAAAGRAGVARKELLTFAQDAAQMGIAFDTTAEDAGGMMAKWRTAFGMGQDQVRTLSDQINALTNTYGGNVTAVAGITTRIGALGKVAGIAAPQIAAMGQVMNSVGVEEEIAATGIKNMMLAMTKGAAATKSQQRAFASLGLDAANVAKAMQTDAGGAISDVLGRIQKLPKEMQAGTLTELFGSESVAAIAPLLANLDRLVQNFALVGDKAKYAGSMQKEYLARIATTEGATGLAGNALQALNISLGTMLLPTVTAASEKIIIVANAVRKWAKEHPELAKGLTMVALAASGLVLGMGALKLVAGVLLGPFSTIFRVIGTSAPMLVRSSGLIRAAAIFLGQGFMRAGLMMLANPMVLIITAIVAAIGLAGYLIYTHWDTIKAAFAMGAAALGQAWDWIKTKFNKSIAWLQALPGKMLSIGTAIMQGLARGIMAAPGAVWNALKSVVMAGVTNIKALLGIKSPSRLFMGIGGYVTEGLALGVQRGAASPVRAAGRLAAGVAAAGMVGGAPATAFAAPGTQSPMRPAGGVAGAGVASPRGGDSYHITIQQQPGENAEALADRVIALIERKKRNTGLGGYADG